ncbi:hypothetical protein PIB30_101023 [Stylosanthes scabra]|uniref:Uncharacterized protein n=1 Tax=Stylosanthes scabra TaxID=79078 RepID=A0ABU6SZQ5_9FABA|nr:hypothetical protein [Stylosanthes scabra]
MIAAIGRRRVPFSIALMHSERFVVMWPQRRPSSTCFIHRSLRNDRAHACMSTECASRHCSSHPCAVYNTHGAHLGGPPIPRIIQCCSDRIRPVRNDHETLLGRDMSSQVRQEERPRLGRLRLNKCKCNRQDIVIPILRHCDQQNPVVFPIQVGPVNGNEILAVLECFDARGKRPKDFVKLSRSMVQSVPIVIRHRFKVGHRAR